MGHLQPDRAFETSNYYINILAHFGFAEYPLDRVN
jgi:hypothetical protein